MDRLVGIKPSLMTTLFTVTASLTEQADHSLKRRNQDCMILTFQVMWLFLEVACGLGKIAHDTLRLYYFDFLGAVAIFRGCLWTGQTNKTLPPVFRLPPRDDHLGPPDHMIPHQTI